MIEKGKLKNEIKLGEMMMQGEKNGIQHRSCTL